MEVDNFRHNRRGWVSKKNWAISYYVIWVISLGKNLYIQMWICALLFQKIKTCNQQFYVDFNSSNRSIGFIISKTWSLRAVIYAFSISSNQTNEFYELASAILPNEITFDNSPFRTWRKLTANHHNENEHCLLIKVYQTFYMARKCFKFLKSYGKHLPSQRQNGVTNFRIFKARYFVKVVKVNAK